MLRRCRTEDRALKVLQRNDESKENLAKKLEVRDAEGMSPTNLDLPRQTRHPVANPSLEIPFQNDVARFSTKQAAAEQ